MCFDERTLSKFEIDINDMTRIYTYQYHIISNAHEFTVSIMLFLYFVHDKDYLVEQNESSAKFKMLNLRWRKQVVLLF